METRSICRVAVSLITVEALLSIGPANARASDPPVITEHPTSQTVCEGVDVTFTVVATGEELSYQWRKDDDPIAGATSDMLTLDAVVADDSGDYDVVVSNPYGSDTSNAATLIVDPGPVIVEHPASQEVCEGTAVTLSVTVSNSATAHEDTIGSTASSGSGARMRGNYYRVDTTTTLTRIEHYLDISASGLIVFYVYEAENLSGPYSLIAQDTLADSGTGAGFYSSNPLAVALQAGKYYIIGAAWPDDHTYYWNSSHPNTTAFGVSLYGFAYAYQDPLPDPPPNNSNGFAYMQRLTTSDLAMTYQWYKDDEAIPGASGPAYTIASMSAADVGDYEVVVTNQCGSATSDIATLTLGLGATITQDPLDQDVCVGGTATFVVVADGPDLTYQWRKDGEDILDATSDSYTIDEATVDDAGDYDVVVTNPCTTLTSAVAVFEVADAAPTISEHPVDQAVCEGDQVTFTVVADGVALQYQWRQDGEDVPDANGDTYTIDAVDPNAIGVYDVVVSNPCGAALSDGATLAVDETLSITEQPVGDLICEGSELVLTVATTGTNVSYQWRKDSEDIDGATGDTYTIEAAILDDSGDYDVVVANKCGEIISDPATVTVVGGPAIEEQPVGGTVTAGDPFTLTVSLDLSSFPNDVDAIGQAETSATGPRLRGNSYEVWQTTTLTLIEHYLDITASGPLVFYVYEAEAEPGPYSLILEDTVAQSGTGLGFYASNPVEVMLEAGKYYLIGAGWPDSHTYYWGGSHPQPTAFGQSVHGYAASYQPELPYDPTPTSANVYYQRLTTVETVACYQWQKDGVDIPGATLDTYSVAAATFGDAGTYQVAITNVCGTVFSEPARIAVIAPATPEWQTPGSSDASAPPEPKRPDPTPWGEPGG